MMPEHVPFTFAELDVWLAHWFEVKDGLPRPYSQTNEDYHVISLQFRFPVETRFGAESLMEAAMVARILDYANGKKGRLYWRVKPEIESRVSPAQTHIVWTGYARLLISAELEVRGIINP